MNVRRLRFQSPPGATNTHTHRCRHHRRGRDLDGHRKRGHGGVRDWLRDGLAVGRTDRIKKHSRLKAWRAHLVVDLAASQPAGHEQERGEEGEGGHFDGCGLARGKVASYPNYRAASRCHHCSPTATAPCFLPLVELVAMKRCGEKADRSTHEDLPSMISSLIARPVTGAHRMPQQL